MSWEAVTKRDFALKGATVGITRGGNVWRLIVYLRRDVAAAMGLQVGDRVAAAYGRGGDAGKLRLARVETGGFALTAQGNRKTTLCVRLPLDRGVAGAQRRSEPVRWSVEPPSWDSRAERAAADGALVLTLPAFALPSETGLVAEAVAAGHVTVCPPAGSGPLPHYDDRVAPGWRAQQQARLARKRGKG